MFVREKTARGHRYLYLVESVRDGGRVRQQIVRALGRKDVLLASGELDRLVASLARHSERAMILSDMEAGRLACTRIGGPLLFGRLWVRLGIADVLADLLRGRGFDFAVERAVFVAVLHRLFVSGSDRACEKWMADYAIPGSDGLQLHHFYRAMAWLGEENGPPADDALAPRCVKDVIEEQLFERRRDCSASCPWGSWTPRRCRSRAPAARRWAPTAIPRTIGRTSRWFSPSFSTARGGRSAPRCCRGTPPTSPCCCRWSTAFASALPSDGCASSPTAA
jgi:hypothetical protein